jgi:hypothetical protein
MVAAVWIWEISSSLNAIENAMGSGIMHKANRNSCKALKATG